jgi:hypothetical protein
MGKDLSFVITLFLSFRLLETYPDLLSDILAQTSEEQRATLSKILSKGTTTF